MIFSQNYPLADLTWFQTGGPARYFCAPHCVDDYKKSLEFAHQKNKNVFVLGTGANILISDDGFNGLVIKPEIKRISHIDDTITAGAGVTIDDLINYALENNLIGLEEFAGIPGTVGGSVYINIHYFKHFLSDFLSHATIINVATGKIKTVDKTWFNFGYDQSQLHTKEHHLLTASFTLKTCSPLEAAYARGRKDEIIRHRNQRYPMARTCGSFFRNFHDHEVSIISNGKKMIFAAYYLDKLGLKGTLSYGKATVSYKHANMIVTQPGATSHDVIMLAQAMQEKVLQIYGIIPQPECQLIGFEEYPLLQKEKLGTSQSQSKVPVYNPKALT